MRRLATYSGRMLSAEPASTVAPNRLSKEVTVYGHEDTSIEPLTVRLFDIKEDSEGVLLSTGGVPLIETFAIETPEPGVLREKVLSAELAVRSLRDGCYEIWDHGHNVRDYDRGGFHLADEPEGPVSWTLAHLRQTLLDGGHTITPPPVNHDKFSVKKRPALDITGTHVDSFEGMRTGPDGGRLKIWRYFINLATEPRFTLISPVHPDDVDRVLPIKWNPTYLDPLFEALNDEMDMLKVPLGPADYDTGRLQVFRTTTTHLPHAEYGYPGDTLAVVDSLE